MNAGASLSAVPSPIEGSGTGSNGWVVRKGVCPCCGSALFGTTLAYQRLPGLDLVYPESPYLCPVCDGAKVAALQQRPYHLERADD